MQPPLSHSLILLLFSTISLHPSAALGASRPKNAILLSDVQSLTLRGGGAKTAHRRVSAIPQLKCVSSPAICRLHEIDVMRCTNQGSGYDAEDVQWSCSAPLPPELKLGSTDVICEGYSGPDDPYVLKGSCGVEYRLVLTEVGERKFPELANGGGGWGWGGGGGNGKEKSDPSAILFVIIFTLVCLWIIYSACIAGNQNGTGPAGQRRRRDGWGGFGGFDPGFGPGGGGGGGGGWDDPPPPYPGGPKSSSQSQGWRPGFWTGLAGGAAAGYAAANRGNRRQEPRDNGYGWGAGPSRPPSYGRSDSRSTSSARYESTGFGSTSRR